MVGCTHVYWAWNSTSYSNPLASVFQAMTKQEATELRGEMNKLSKGEIEEWLQWVLYNNAQCTHSKKRLEIKTMLEGYLHHFSQVY